MTPTLALVRPDREPSWQRLPRWRGFNLLNMFIAGQEYPFRELDFEIIADWGFNFVRIPMDYRCWINDGHWRVINQEPLRRIDQVIEWGIKWGIHVNLNFHRAPGYCVNGPKEASDLWSDHESQAVTALHWSGFANRYQGVSNNHLSFNLINEPGFIAPLSYKKVVQTVVDAIRSWDPERLIIVDGLGYGTLPVPELIPLEVAQSTRGYSPSALTFFGSPWHEVSDQGPRPTWPIKHHVGRYLYGSARPDLQSTLTIEGDFPAGTEVCIEINQVSQKCLLEARCDSQMLGRERMTSGPGVGPWKEVRFNEQHNIFQNIFDKELSWSLNRSASSLTFEVTEGDWLSFNSITVTVPSKRPAVIRPISSEWGMPQGTILLDKDSNVTSVSNSDLFSKRDIQDRTITPWSALNRAGVGVMVGEWGAYNRAPHAHVLAWAEDNLSLWYREGWGWALWNLYGPFGIIDSDRHDVTYGRVAGQKLDTEFLRLLQKY